MTTRRKAATKPRRKTPARTKTSTGQDNRYDKLYLLERVTGKSRWSILTGQHEIKIGVTSKSAKERKENIDLDLKGDVELITWLYLPGTAYQHEQRLLQKYGDRAFNPGGGAGAGNTEWLRITWLMYIFVLYDYWLIRNSLLVSLFKTLAFLLAFFYAWVQTQGEG